MVLYNGLFVGLFLSHNAETFLVDSDSCLPLQRLLQHPDSISSPKGVEAAADSELNSESADDLDQSPDPYHSHRIYMLLELFSQYSPSALHTVINKENETCMFYILRMSLDYGKCKSMVFYCILNMFFLANLLFANVLLNNVKWFFCKKIYFLCGTGSVSPDAVTINLY